jgi:hypothetical protein
VNPHHPILCCRCCWCCGEEGTPDGSTLLLHKGTTVHQKHSHLSLVVAVTAASGRKRHLHVTDTADTITAVNCAGTITYISITNITIPIPTTIPTITISIPTIIIINPTSTTATPALHPHYPLLLLCLPQHSLHEQCTNHGLARTRRQDGNQVSLHRCLHHL